MYRQVQNRNTKSLRTAAFPRQPAVKSSRVNTQHPARKHPSGLFLFRKQNVGFTQLPCRRLHVLARHVIHVPRQDVLTSPCVSVGPAGVWVLGTAERRGGSRYPSLFRLDAVAFLVAGTVMYSPEEFPPIHFFPCRNESHYGKCKAL
ncbi:Hypothetical predicted protein [Marmota monax]|uniref:Uncharacterized protein n=1 Tax=Marmota monax TaxID=9995 RepID=A0A5E4C6L6_MARMO|nr:hypothetical protein GHT09_016180 [Marmota monax]VTJ76779.1 Hypothetical predicted protein [Marmota monax]